MQEIPSFGELALYGAWPEGYKDERDQQCRDDVPPKPAVVKHYFTSDRRYSAESLVLPCRGLQREESQKEVVELYWAGKRHGEAGVFCCSAAMSPQALISAMARRSGLSALKCRR